MSEHMWVKICGTTNLEDAMLAVDAGADAVGFVFAESARKVTVEQVASIVECLPPGVEKIGVFITQNVDEIHDAVRLAGLTGVQLHSTFSPSLAREVKARSEGRLRVIQAVDFEADGEAAAEKWFGETVRSVAACSAVDAVLLDTAVGGSSGGTGVAFDWEKAAGVLARVWPTDAGCGLIVAGGLRQENVGEAIVRLRPWGVDVVSGVEAAKGKKDPMRLRGFVEEARCHG